MSERAKALLGFVVSDNRVWPDRWHQFHKIIKEKHPQVPNPLILGGSIASDMAKRITLLHQIHEIKEDPDTLERADDFLRKEPYSAWNCAPDPLSNKNIYGQEDVPPLMYLLLLP